MQYCLAIVIFLSFRRNLLGCSVDIVKPISFTIVKSLLWDFKIVRQWIPKDFPGGSDGKESACNARDPSSIPELGRSPGGGQGNPLQYSCLENSHGQRNPVGYSPWGRRESDMTERLSTAHIQEGSSILACSAKEKLCWYPIWQEKYTGLG